MFLCRHLLFYKIMSRRGGSGAVEQNDSVEKRASEIFYYYYYYSTYGVYCTRHTIITKGLFNSLFNFENNKEKEKKSHPLLSMELVNKQVADVIILLSLQFTKGVYYYY